MVGRCSLRRVDIFDDSMMYEMISHYYTFKSSKESQDLQLSVREQEIELRPVWIDIEEAIIKNKKYLDECSTDNFLKQQEILVLELIQDSSEMISAMFI